MPYRVEESKNARAGCKNTECKAAGVKIQKGELRFATQVTIQDHTSWVYKHWGCVTPAQIANLIEESGGDTDMVDGYDELPAELQEKVDFALQNAHVPDEDWKGDIECNRPGQKGFRLTAAQKKKASKSAEDGDEAPKPKAKRGRANKGDDDDEAPAPKKARGTGKKAAAKEEDEEDEDAATKQHQKSKPKRGKKASTKKEAEEDGEEEPELPKAKRVRKTPLKEDAGEGDVADESEPPKAKRGKKTLTDKAVPQKRSGRKKATVNYEEE